MGKRDDELVVASLANRWVTQSNPAAGTTCVAQVSTAHSPKTPNYKHSISGITYSVRNTTAAAVTCTLSVRDASIAGTVLAQWDFIVATNTAQQGAFPGIDIPGLTNHDVALEFGTPASSVTQKVSASGWTDAMVSG